MRGMRRLERSGMSGARPSTEGASRAAPSGRTRRKGKFLAECQADWRVACPNRRFAGPADREERARSGVDADFFAEADFLMAALDLPSPFDETAALFAAARGGAVLISPCISDGERQIAREALAAGYRLVSMHNKGFSKFQKPSGRYFDACAEGRLLMLAPVAWPYQPNEKPMTRADATAMNRLCQWLAGDGAAMINYHGMTPADIDRLALAAVTPSGHNVARERVKRLSQKCMKMCPCRLIRRRFDNGKSL